MFRDPDAERVTAAERTEAEYAGIGSENPRSHPGRECLNALVTTFGQIIHECIIQVEDARPYSGLFQHSRQRENSKAGSACNWPYLPALRFLRVFEVRRNGGRNETDSVSQLIISFSFVRASAAAASAVASALAASPLSAAAAARGVPLYHRHVMTRRRRSLSAKKKTLLSRFGGLSRVLRHHLELPYA